MYMLCNVPHTYERNLNPAWNSWCLLSSIIFQSRTNIHDLEQHIVNVLRCESDRLVWLTLSCNRHITVDRCPAIRKIEIIILLLNSLEVQRMKRHISMAKCKTVVSPLLTHWSYCSLALSHRILCDNGEQLFHSFFFIMLVFMYLRIS